MGCCYDKDSGKPVDPSKGASKQAVANVEVGTKPADPTTVNQPSKAEQPAATSEDILITSQSSQAASAPVPNVDPKPSELADNNTKVMSQLGPYIVEVEVGKEYFYCTCGRSTNQPFCTGDHKNTPFTPLKYVPELAGPVYFCGCRATKKEVTCDGSHQYLKW